MLQWQIELCGCAELENIFNSLIALGFNVKSYIFVSESNFILFMNSFANEPIYDGMNTSPRVTICLPKY